MHACVLTGDDWLSRGILVGLPVGFGDSWTVVGDVMLFEKTEYEASKKHRADSNLTPTKGKSQ